MHNLSLKTQIFLTLFVIITVGYAFTAIISYKDSTHEIDEIFDAQLTQSARVLNGLVEFYKEYLPPIEQPLIIKGWLPNKHFEKGKEATSQGHEYERKVAFQVWDNKKLLLRSETAPSVAFAALEPGYQIIRLGEFDWRVFTLKDPTYGYWLQVAERYDAREDLVGDIVEELIFPLLIGFPIIFLLCWLAIQHSLKYLTQLETKLKNFDVQNLKPIFLKNPPKEIKLIVSALNQLLDRLSLSLRRERQFIEDAAHELKTPLAVIKILAQNLINQTTPHEREEHIRKLIRAIDRSDRVAHQLLTISRLDPEIFPQKFEALNPISIIKEVCQEIAPIALLKNQEIVFHSEIKDALVLAKEELIYILSKNIIDNAIRYSPNNSSITINISAENEKLIIKVMDNGPGISSLSQLRIFDRFYRENPGETTGAGLGLAIVKTIIESLQGSIELNTLKSTSGLEVIITLPILRTEAKVTTLPEKKLASPNI